MMNKDTLLELDRLEVELNALLPKLSKRKVMELKRVTLKHLQKVYNVKNKPPLYGTLNKGFSQEELDRFLNCIDNKKFRLLFSYQAWLGLRVGEVAKINVGNINMDTHELKIFTEKARVNDIMLIPSPLFGETLSYLQENEEQIKRAQGYLFFPNREASHSKRLEPYLNLNYIRKVFRGYIRVAGLDEVYGTSEGEIQRHLHRLTTHSLRHFAITKFAKQTNGNLILTSRFARHLKPETTLTYIHSDKSELYKYVEQMVKPIEATFRSP